MLNLVEHRCILLRVLKCSLIVGPRCVTISAMERASGMRLFLIFAIGSSLFGCSNHEDPSGEYHIRIDFAEISVLNALSEPWDSEDDPPDPFACVAVKNGKFCTEIIENQFEPRWFEEVFSYYYTWGEMQPEFTFSIEDFDYNDENSTILDEKFFDPEYKTYYTQATVCNSQSLLSFIFSKNLTTIDTAFFSKQTRLEMWNNCLQSKN